jgi:hypothetical protein
VELNQEERDQLSKMPSGGQPPARKLKRAQILPAADAGRRSFLRATSRSHRNARARAN